MLVADKFCFVCRPAFGLFLRALQLREIEIIVAARLEEPDETPEAEILKKIQDILYQTEVSGVDGGPRRPDAS